MDQKAADEEAGRAEAQAEKTHPEGPLPGVGIPADLGVDEKQLIRKLDMHLIPLVMALYLFSFLDRSDDPRVPRARWVTTRSDDRTGSTSGTHGCTSWSRISGSRATSSRSPSPSYS